LRYGLWASVLAIAAPAAHAQLVDLTASPAIDTQPSTGVAKSLGQQVAAGVGNTLTPGSSIYIIKRDPARSIRRGRQLFQRKFTEWQGLGPRTGDGTGNINADKSIGAGVADSCAGCHGRPRGSAGFGGDVVTRPDSRDAPHLFGLGLIEQLGDEITTDLRAIRTTAIADATRTRTTVTRTLTSKGINYGQISVNASGVVNTSGVRGVNPDLRVRPFFAEGGTISMREFLVGAFNAEMGIDAVDPLLEQAANGARIVTPSGMVLDGRLDTIERPPTSHTGADVDGDGVVNELPTALVDHMEFYLLNYFKAGTYKQTAQTAQGLTLFNQIGCNSCHIQNLTINQDRRIADVETVYDETRGIFNNLFGTAALRLVEQRDDPNHPTLKLPALQPFVVRNFFADLKRHYLGPNFEERNYDGTIQREFMTEALWGVGSTSPYGHDGRSINLNEVILRHEGSGSEANTQVANYRALSDSQRAAIFEFLNSLVLFPPDDTASTLNPGVTPENGGNPQRQHGGFNLGALFNNPAEPE
jgi:hypothetical protein